MKRERPINREIASAVIITGDMLVVRDTSGRLLPRYSGSLHPRYNRLNRLKTVLPPGVVVEDLR